MGFDLKKLVHSKNSIQYIVPFLIFLVGLTILFGDIQMESASRDRNLSDSIRHQANIATLLITEKG